MGVSAGTGTGWPGIPQGYPCYSLVERSVRFNFNEEAVVRLLPIEGEISTETVTADKPIEAEYRDSDVAKDTVVDPEPDSGRGKRIRKESEYVRMLREGTATTGQKTVLPRGMRPITQPTPIVDETVKVDSEHAMASVIESAEGSMPTYQEALKRPDWPKWEEAINKELDSLKNTGTYELVKRTPEINVVDSKWVLKIKKNSAGEVERYKARLVARGFTQIYGVDYYETYAPVARLASFRILLAIAARNGWPIHSFDFDTAYLNSKFDENEEIYIEQPPGYATKD